MSDLILIVNGVRYGGWQSIRVTRSIEALAGSFDVTASDKWGNQEIPWPIVEEDECSIQIDGDKVIDGFVDRRSLRLTDPISVAGRDATAALVDCSAVLDSWTFRNASVLDVAKKVAEPFGIRVTLQPGVVLPKPQRKLVVSPGDSPYQVIQRAAVSTGLLAVSDGAGGLLLTRAGATRCPTSLVQGENLLDAGVDYDATERFARYVVMTQVAGTDEASAGATQIRAEATDEGVRRGGRVLLIRPESGVTTDFARQRGDWEARIRAARAETPFAVVRGWRQGEGRPLWPVNSLVSARIPRIGVSGDMLISEAEHSLTEQGEVTRLSLVRPDAFSPEPQGAVKASGTKWKVRAGGNRKVRAGGNR